MRFALRPRTIMLAAFVSTSVIHLVFALAMARLLTPGDFGLLAFTQTVLYIGGLVLSSGFPAALTTGLIAGDAAGRGRLIRGAALANLLLAAAISGLIVLLFALGPFRRGFEAPEIVAVVALTLPCLALIAIVRAAAQGLEHFGIMAALQLIEVLAKVLAGVALVRAGFGVDGAIAASLIGALIATGAGLWFLAALLGVPIRGQFMRPTLQSAGSLFGALIGLSLLLNMDQVMLKLLGGAERSLIGQYQAATMLANAPYHLASALLPIMFTRAAQLGPIGRTRALTGEALRVALLAIVPLALALAAVPDICLRAIYPQATAVGAQMVPILALAHCVLTFVAIMCVPFNATGNARTPALALAGVIAVEVVLILGVVPAWHTLGAATACLAAGLLALAALGHAYVRSGPAGERFATPALRWCARYGVAVGIGALIWAIVPAGPNAIERLLAVAAGFASYLGCAFALRLVELPRRAAGAPTIANERALTPAMNDDAAAPAFVSHTG